MFSFQQLLEPRVPGGLYSFLFPGRLKQHNLDMPKEKDLWLGCFPTLLPAIMSVPLKRLLPACLFVMGLVVSCKLSLQFFG